MSWIRTDPQKRRQIFGCLVDMQDEWLVYFRNLLQIGRRREFQTLRNHFVGNLTEVLI
jgi:hypothetical protein